MGSNGNSDTGENVQDFISGITLEGVVDGNHKRGTPGGVGMRRGGGGQNGFTRTPTTFALQELLGDQSSGSDRMDMEKFHFWYEAIEKDNHQIVEQTLSQCDEKHKQMLINGRFQFNIAPDILESVSLKNLPCAFERPLVLAAVFKAKEVLKIFLNNNGDVFIQDMNASTVLHGIIWAVALNPKLEMDYIGIYELLIDNLSKDQRRQLIFLENSEGLRPIELATRLCTFGLFQRILDTEGAYLYNQGELGGYKCVWFDVTDYESRSRGQRFDRSPLKMMSALEKEHLNNAQNAKLLQHPAIEKWIDTKITTNVPYLIAWFLTRMFYTMLIFIGATSPDYLADSKQNVSFVGSGYINLNDFCPDALFDISRTKAYWAIGLVIVFSVAIVIFDIVDNVLHQAKFKHRDERLYHIFGSKNFVVRTRFYRVCNFLLAASVLAFYICRFLRYRPIASKMYMLANILNIWSLLFFIQLLPALGYFVTIIQRMLKDMFHFLVLYVILFFSFSQTFYNLFFMNSVCSEEFYTVPRSMYSTFKIMLNMVDMDFQGADQTDVAILHITYVIVVPILLVNFLIALMSNSVSDVAENRYIIMTLQRLSAALLVEERLGRVISRLYQIQQKKLFVVKEGRVYVQCFIMKNQSL